VSWSASFPEGVRGDALDEDLDPAKANTSPPDFDKWDDAPAEQLVAARSLVYDLIEKGAVGNSSKTFNVTLSGHANPDHEPAEGWANDMVSISVSQRT
jgi:hypothetical protein